MRHLGTLLLFISSVIRIHTPGAVGHSLHICNKQLEFSCSDGGCVSLQLVCNGQNDCEDGSDENQCGCKASEFLCGDGLCIRQTWRCDNLADCKDGSDEVGCEQDECRLNNGGCSHQCVDEPMGFICLCPDNMRLVDDTQCVQVNTCLESDVCDQKCLYVSGRLTCDCRHGYLKNLTSGKCQAEGGGAQLAFTTSKGVHVLQNMTDTRPRELAPSLPGNGPVVTLAWNQTLYWAQRGQTLIYRISLDEKDPVLVLQTHSSVTNLAMDWIHQLLYWTSLETGSVHVALLDGSAQRELLTMLDHPTAVAVDPLQGFLFWTQCGREPKIERSALDGRNRIPVVTSYVHRPLALTLDVPRHLLYWYDQRLRSISRVDFDGHHRKTVVESNGYMDQVLGLSVFEGLVFWSDNVTHSIWQADKHNGRNMKVLLSGLSSPAGLLILHPALQPKGPSVCERHGTVCRHACVISLSHQSPKFSCNIPEDAGNRSQESPTISHSVPASTLSNATMTAILFLIMFFSVLLLGVTAWWWRGEFLTSRPLSVLSFALKESQDPLISRGPHVVPNTSVAKETLLKPQMDADDDDDDHMTKLPVLPVSALVSELEI